MTPSNFFRSSMLLSSTARAATRTKIISTSTAQQSYAAISRRTISTSRSFLSINKSQEQSPIPSSSTLTQHAAQDLTNSSSIIIENNNNEFLAAEEEDVSSSGLNPPSLRNYPYTIKTGTVTSVGFMDKTVRVAYQHHEWDRHIRKSYQKTTTYLVSDPRNSLREGDVIEFSSGAPKSRRVRHVVERILAPFGVGIEDRPAVMTREEREVEKMEKRMKKIARKAEKIAAQASSEGNAEGNDVESITRRILESKDHIGRIRSLVLERTAAI